MHRPSTLGGSALRNGAGLVVLTALGVLPIVANWMGYAFYLDLGTRMVCLAIAAVGLNLILGFGGMISFGHAAFIGIGAYCVGIPVYYGVTDAFLQIFLAVGISALFALLTGAICLRTKGVYFIMITMAFSQMVFFAFVSIDTYGADDGLVIETRSVFPLGIDLENNLVLFLFCYVSLLLVVLLVYRVVNSRFGLVIQGARANERRMRAIGYNTYLYRLVCYVMSGAICGYAGALLGNFTSFISPEMMDWTRSGELMFMVILGGAGTWSGPVIGAVFLILLEEILSSYFLYWQLFLGLFLIAVVLFTTGGINGLLERWSRRE